MKIGFQKIAYWPNYYNNYTLTLKMSGKEASVLERMMIAYQI